MDRNIFDRPVYALHGIPVDAISTREACEKLLVSIRAKSPCFFTTPNLNFLVACQTDAEFQNSVIDSDLIVADAMPLVRIARLLGIPLPERVAGSTVFENLRRTLHSPRLSVFFFGGPAGIAEKANEVLNQEHLGMTGSGAIYPGFGNLNDMLAPTMLTSINECHPDMLVVALGAKRGQAWIQAAKSQLNATVITHLGAVVNFVAGSVARAPVWIQRIGMEWLWRIYQEPGLFTRYFSDGKAYIRILVKHILPLKRAQKNLARERQNYLPSECKLYVGINRLTLRLTGSATSEILPLLRANLKNVFDNPPMAVELDLKECTYFDAACLGQFMLLLKVQRNRGQPMLITNVNAKLQRLFELHAATYMLK